MKQLYLSKELAPFEANERKQRTSIFAPFRSKEQFEEITSKFDFDQWLFFGQLMTSISEGVMEVKDNQLYWITK